MFLITSDSLGTPFQIGENQLWKEPGFLRKSCREQDSLHSGMSTDTGYLLLCGRPWAAPCSPPHWFHFLEPVQGDGHMQRHRGDYGRAPPAGWPSELIRRPGGLLPAQVTAPACWGQQVLRAVEEEQVVGGLPGKSHGQGVGQSQTPGLLGCPRIRNVSQEGGGTGEAQGEKQAQSTRTKQRKEDLLQLSGG